jgi:hypothetical protein
MHQDTQDDKQIEDLKSQLLELKKTHLQPVGEIFGPSLCTLQELLNKQGRRGDDGFTKFVTKQLGLALSTAYDWIKKYKTRELAPKPKAFPKLGKGGRGKKGPEPVYNPEDLEKFEGTAYVRDLSLFSYENTAEIIEMCEDKDLQNFLGAIDRYDCAYKAVRLAYTEAKTKAGTSSGGTQCEDRSIAVAGGLFLSAAATNG